MNRRWLRAVHRFAEDVNVAFGIRWSRLICGCGAKSPAFMNPRRALRWMDRHAAASPNCFQFLDREDVD